MPFIFLISGNEHEAEMNIMQCVFTGPPRVGKSSFWQRVLGIMPERQSPSTDITSVEGCVRLDIRGSCGFAVDVSQLEWKKLLFEEEMEGFVTLVTQQSDWKLFDKAVGGIVSETQGTKHAPKQHIPTIAEPTVKPAQPDISSKRNIPVASATSSSELNIFTSTSQTFPSLEPVVHTGRKTEEEQPMSTQDVPSPSQVLEQALMMMRQAEASKNIDSVSFVYFTDTGGQPEFQELLSLLMAGCNTVLIVFNLEHDLHSNPPLEYLPTLHEPPVRYQSEHTVGEMLWQSLVSVPVGRDEEEEEEEEGISKGSENPASVLFIGTHKDTVSPQRIEEMNRNLIELIRDTPQYQAHVVKQHSAGNIIFAVDNFSSLQNDEDFVAIRRATQSLIYGNSCFKVNARTSWLFLGIVFQKLSDSQPIISLDQCKEIARQCGISIHDIDMALKFLHCKIGAIRFYNTENLYKVVFLKPQLIINLLSQFMRRAFKKPPTHRAIFDMRDVGEVVKECKFVQENFMLNLTHDLLLSAPHADTTVQHPRYYLTCMLPTEKASKEENDPTALLFTLKGYVLPTGIGRATITSILQKRMQSDAPWKINYHKLFRNSIEFTAGPSNTMFKVKCTKRCLSISVLSAAEPSTGSCLKVRKCIEAIISEVLQLYRYGNSSAPITGFLCTSSHDAVGSAPHFATLTPEGALLCSATRTVVELPRKLQHWFMVSMFRRLKWRSSVATGAQRHLSSTGGVAACA